MKLSWFSIQTDGQSYNTSCLQFYLVIQCGTAGDFWLVQFSKCVGPILVQVCRLSSKECLLLEKLQKLIIASRKVGVES